jgi:hypothetical protein
MLAGFAIAMSFFGMLSQRMIRNVLDGIHHGLVLMVPIAYTIVKLRTHLKYLPSADSVKTRVPNII